MDKVESIFKVIHYRHNCNDKRKLRYPSYRVYGNDEIYFRTLEEVEHYMDKVKSLHNRSKDNINDDNWINMYAYVVIEIPLGLKININILDQYLSLRIYLPDGTLWGDNTYANFIPDKAPVREFDYWSQRNRFCGRKPAEIKFKPGDIVEVLGCPGNDYWGDETVNLAVIINTPLTNADDLYRDTYELVSFALDAIDHAPTICVFQPTKQVSSRRRKALQAMYDKYKK